MGGLNFNNVEKQQQVVNDEDEKIVKIRILWAIISTLIFIIGVCMIIRLSFLDENNSGIDPGIDPAQIRDTLYRSNGTADPRLQSPYYP